MTLDPSSDSLPAKPAAEATPPSLTYEPYYGLREKPFSLSSDPRFLYTGPSHIRAFEELLAGIKRREGVIVLSGEIGTGKTTLCRGVLEALDRRTFTTFVRDPFLSREDLLKTLLIDFGVMSIDDLKSGRLNGATRPDLSYPLYEFLDSLVPLQAFAVLIIDEAQNLSHSLLEEIRILSELEAREKLLQVVLVGQPELRSSLRLPQLRQVDQRVSVRCELSPLPAEEVPQYIAHRLGIASVGGAAVEFTPEAARLVARASNGVPRVINLICDRALHRGFLSRSTNIDAATVFVAVEDLGRTLELDHPAIVSVEHSPVRSAATTDRPAKSAPAPSPAVEADTATGTPDPAVESPSAATAVRSATHPERPITSAEASTPADTDINDLAVSAFPTEPVVEKRAPSYETGGDALDEFSHEADLVSAGSRWPRVAGGAAVLAVMAAAAAGVWLGLHTVDAGAVPVPSSATSAAPVTTVSKVAAVDAVPPRAAAVQAEAAPEREPALAVPAQEDAEAAGPAYVIQVASFQSRSRAQRLLDELHAEGYRAEGIDVDLGTRGIWIQVLVGRYHSLAEAEADLAGIRQRPSYDDARLIAISE